MLHQFYMLQQAVFAFAGSISFFGHASGENNYQAVSILDHSTHQRSKAITSQTFKRREDKRRNNICVLSQRNSYAGDFGIRGPENHRPGLAMPNILVTSQANSANSGGSYNPCPDYGTHGLFTMFVLKEADSCAGFARLSAAVAWRQDQEPICLLDRLVGKGQKQQYIGRARYVALHGCSCKRHSKGIQPNMDLDL